MTKSKKIRRHSRQKSNELSFKPTPSNHRFDKEIADVASTTLLKLQFMRISTPTSIEKEARKYLRGLIAQRKLTCVAAKFYDRILKTAIKKPLTRVVMPILESTFDEYCSVKNHMDKFGSKSMKRRLENLFSALEDNNWRIIKDYKEGNAFPDVMNCLVLSDDYDASFDEQGNILKSFTIATRTQLISELNNISYHNGIIFYREVDNNDFDHLVVFPDNNIPGAPFVPDC